jgi:hypothetical protein
MPTNKIRRLRTSRMSVQLDETIKQFLLYGETPERGTPAWPLYTSRHFGPEELLAAWNQHKAMLLKENPHPWVMKYLEIKSII